VYLLDGSFVVKWQFRPDISIANYGLSTAPNSDLFVTYDIYVDRYYPGGTMRGWWGYPGNADGQFYTAQGTAVDDDGNVYVGDDSRVQKFTPTGSFLCKWGGEGAGDGQFGISLPDIAVHGKDVYVLDAVNRRVQKFSYITTPTLRSTWGQLKKLYR